MSLSLADQFAIEQNWVKSLPVSSSLKDTLLEKLFTLQFVNLTDSSPCAQQSIVIDPKNESISVVVPDDALSKKTPPPSPPKKKRKRKVPKSYELCIATKSGTSHERCGRRSKLAQNSKSDELDQETFDNIFSQNNRNPTLYCGHHQKLLENQQKDVEIYQDLTTATDTSNTDAHVNGDESPQKKPRLSSSSSEETMKDNDHDDNLMEIENDSGVIQLSKEDQQLIIGQLAHNTNCDEIPDFPPGYTTLYHNLELHIGLAVPQNSEGHQGPLHSLCIYKIDQESEECYINCLSECSNLKSFYLSAQHHLSK